MLPERTLIATLFLLLTVNFSYAQDLPRCLEREFVTEFPLVSPQLYCIELPIVADSADDRTYTSMIFDADGTLYATHPYRGQVVALVDTDNDALPDEEAVIAEDLRYPHGIDIYDGVLYAIGDGIIYTISDGEVSVLVDDLPGGRGFIARGILVHEDTLYAAIPSPCDFCAGDDPLHGTVIRMNLDGAEREVIARGLRYPAGLEFYQGDIWVTDIARDDYTRFDYYDEVNRIDLDDDSVTHFGFPYCVGQNSVPDLEGNFDCATATAPEITIQTQASPFSLTRYDSDLFPHLSNHLIIVLTGSNNSAFIAGHALLGVEITEESYHFQVIAPADFSVSFNLMNWEQEDGYNILMHASEFVNNQGGGIFPHYPYDVAVSPEGWLYFSVGGKGIYVLRPQT